MGKHGNPEDIVGKTYGYLEVIGVSDKNPNKVICKCKLCGNTVMKSYRTLKETNPKNPHNCGCIGKQKTIREYREKVLKKFKPGTRYDMLTVEKIHDVSDDDNWNLVEFRCACGNRCTKRTHHFIPMVERWKDYNAKGIRTRLSCGCQDSVNRSITVINGKTDSLQGKSKSPLYYIWYAMHQRCENPNNKRYPVYGGRGIYVCDEWSTPEEAEYNTGFLTFFEWAVSNGYERGLSIDRIDNDGPYAPWNCRWATKDMQASNTSKNKHIRYNGQVYTYSQFLRYMSEQSGHTWKMVDLHYYIKRGLSLNQMVWNMLHPNDKVYIQSVAGKHINNNCKGCLVDSRGFARLIPKYDIELLD